MDIQESAASLLLRSPYLSVSHIMHLLDISDSEFRRFIVSNNQIAQLMDARRAGTLKAPRREAKECNSCGEWFMPYASARQCSDECTRSALLADRKYR